MLRFDVRSCSLIVGWSIVLSSLASVGAAQTVSGAYDETVSRAVRLLPKQPTKILVVDAARAVRQVDAQGRRVEAFAMIGENVVYLIAQGDTLKRARRGPGLFDYVLATLIWHEMAHIAGADEREAQRQEEELWREYLLARRVDTGRGLKYLVLLTKRH